MNQELFDLQYTVDRLLEAKTRINVLEAGCGSVSHLRINKDAYITGIDISSSQLENHPSLDERILGDLQTYTLPAAAYDLIVCWDVLEHLSRPMLALQNMVTALGKSSVLVLSFPNVLSLKGIVAKWTPYQVHRWVYKQVYDQKVGTAGYEPFPTYLHYSLCASKMKHFAVDHGLSVEFFTTFESGIQRRFREKYGMVKGRWQGVKLLAKLLSLGFVTADETDFLMVFYRRS